MIESREILQMFKEDNRVIKALMSEEERKTFVQRVAPVAHAFIGKQSKVSYFRNPFLFAGTLLELGYLIKAYELQLLREDISHFRMQASEAQRKLDTLKRNPIIRLIVKITGGEL